MGLDKHEFRQYVLEWVLRKVLAPELPYGENAAQITMESIWHESGMLVHRRQHPFGPARGLGQCELPTFEWLTRTYLPKEYPAVWGKFAALSPNWPAIQFQELDWNDALAVALCRCRYLPDPHVIPATLEGRAAYWLRVYNCSGEPERAQHYIEHARLL